MYKPVSHILYWPEGWTLPHSTDILPISCYNSQGCKDHESRELVYLVPTTQCLPCMRPSTNIGMNEWMNHSYRGYTLSILTSYLSSQRYQVVILAFITTFLKQKQREQNWVMNSLEMLHCSTHFSLYTSSCCLSIFQETSHIYFTLWLHPTINDPLSCGWCNN